MPRILYLWLFLESRNLETLAVKLLNYNKGKYRNALCYRILTLANHQRKANILACHMNPFFKNISLLFIISCCSYYFCSLFFVFFWFPFLKWLCNLHFEVWYIEYVETLNLPHSLFSCISACNSDPSYSFIWCEMLTFNAILMWIWILHGKDLKKW